MTDAVVAPVVEGPEFTRIGLNLADRSLGAKITHIRFNIIPDGGVSRVRLLGKPVS